MECCGNRENEIIFVSDSMYVSEYFPSVSSQSAHLQINTWNLPKCKKGKASFMTENRVPIELK